MTPRLIELLSDKKRRENYADAHLNSYLTAQLSVVREQRKLTQEQLAETTGTSQSTIARMESVNYGKWSVQALKKAAYAMGCRLRISLETFGSIPLDLERMDRASLERESAEATLSRMKSGPTEVEVPEPALWMRPRLLKWLNKSDADLPLFKTWLSGYELPPVGDLYQPWEVIYLATPMNECGESEYKWNLMDRCKDLLDEYKERIIDRKESKSMLWVPNLLRLVREMKDIDRYGAVLDETLARALETAKKHRVNGAFALPVAERIGLTGAITPHQTSDLAFAEWGAMRKARTSTVLFGNRHDAKIGLDMAPERYLSRAQAILLKAEEEVERSAVIPLAESIYTETLKKEPVRYFKTVNRAIQVERIDPDTAKDSLSVVDLDVAIDTLRSNFLDSDTKGTTKGVLDSILRAKIKNTESTEGSRDWLMAKLSELSQILPSAV
jgi:transcriptional regulator with XRE-family HTH domain